MSSGVKSVYFFESPFSESNCQSLLHHILFKLYTNYTNPAIKNVSINTIFMFKKQY